MKKKVLIAIIILLGLSVVGVGGVTIANAQNSQTVESNKSEQAMTVRVTKKVTAYREFSGEQNVYYENDRQEKVVIKPNETIKIYRHKYNPVWYVQVGKTPNQAKDLHLEVRSNDWFVKE